MLQTHHQSVHIHGYPASPESLPPSALAGRRYQARFAQTPAELEALLRLRFDVFNLELGEGLATSFATSLDRDEYDAGCHHLVVSAPDAPLDIVGTYRMQTSDVAERHRGFYSASEFDLSTLPPTILDHAVEVGRACVASAHRNTQVLLLLWRGLAQYVAFNGKRYLFGCCSVSTQDARVGWRTYNHLRRVGFVDSRFDLSPLANHALDGAATAVTDDEPVSLPPLMRLYLRYGGKVIGTPAIDRRFGTIDFFVLFDIGTLSDERYRLLFSDPQGGSEVPPSW
jgi:putative hemolysin